MSKDQLAQNTETGRGISTRPLSSVLRRPSLAGLVVLAGSQYPIPSRTRPLNSPAPMVLSLKAWKSRSLPGLPRTELPLHDHELQQPPQASLRRFLFAATALTPHTFSGPLEIGRMIGHHGRTSGPWTLGPFSALIVHVASA